MGLVSQITLDVDGFVDGLFSPKKYENSPLINNLLSLCWGGEGRGIGAPLPLTGRCRGRVFFTIFYILLATKEIFNYSDCGRAFESVRAVFLQLRQHLLQPLHGGCATLALFFLSLTV